MRPRAFLFVCALSVPALIGAGTGRAASIRLSKTPLDTILRPDLDRPPLTVRMGLVADPSEPHVRMGLRRIPVSSEALGGGPGPEPFGVDGDVPRLAGPRPGPRLALPGWIEEELMADVLRFRVADLERPGADSALFLPPAAPPRTPPPEPAAGATERFVTEYADLAMRVRSRMELGGDWARFEPCEADFKATCTPGLVPQLSPEFLFGVQVDGSIADRVRVDVDFDQAREFDAANRINIFYEGREDDIIRRLDVGDVTFRMPRSRFLTEGLPAGNFGFQAEGQLGPIDFQGVWAQQRGDLNTRVFRLSGVGDQRGFVQADTIVLDDADFVQGQFFFLLDPALLDGWPHVDVLSLDPSAAPLGQVPDGSPIQLYRFEDDATLQQQVDGLIQAEAVAVSPTDTLVEAGWFRYLQPGVDYFTHASGLWVALRTPLRDDEMLAVTYITATGDTIGDYNPERLHNAGQRPNLRLLKASGSNHRPGRASWDFEMHQVYRVSGSRDVEDGSVEATLSLGELSQGRTFKRLPSGRDATFLKLLGLDEEAPIDRVDRAFVYTPDSDLFNDDAPVQGTFLVFPTLRPFAEPPPVPSLGLSAAAAAEVLADDSNPVIYDEEDVFERENGGRFRLTIAYRLRSEGVISSFSLGAFGLREGSERITLGDRLLTRGIDYEIDYDVGQVRLLDAEALFATDPGASVRASWEQRSLFEVSPTQVFGFSTHSDLGGRGGLDILGLYRSEQTVVRRPVLGTEPGATLLGGVAARYSAPLPWLDRALDLVPGLRSDGGTTLDLEGELAMSFPDPNTDGRAFVDDFDASAQLPVSMVDERWLHGSVPASTAGAETVLPALPGASNAGSLTWQTQWILEAPNGDSVGIHEGYLPREQIDRQIRVAGSELREPGLLLALGGSTAAAPLVWRSITTSLSTQGLDLTRTEFLEVYVAGDGDTRLVIDLGTVSEDAFVLDSLGNTSGTRPDGRPWGLGRLDQEADPLRGELWSTATDESGVWAESCRAEPGGIYRIGDPRSVCTRGNGRPDSEDLDADGVLDIEERHLRYVVTLDGSSPFLARPSSETGTPFQLYRIPIRGASALQVGGAFGEAELRSVRHLRVTVAGPPRRQVRLARMRLVGSRWIKRSGEGVLAGIGGDTLAVAGRVEISSVSRVTEGPAYVSPPGVLEELVDPTTAFAGQGIEFNERALGVRFEELGPGRRMEVYQRFPQRPRNFLSYREARLWVVARSGDFGLDRPTSFFLKVGSDPENFYLYRTPLPGPAGPGGVLESDWLPEVRVDFERWFDLRQRAERVLLGEPRQPGDPPVVLWSADSTYAVSLSDRGRAPNLAAVRELSLGVWNQGETAAEGEIWVNELRLDRPLRDPGIAGSVDLRLEAGGALSSRLRLSSRDSDFRQLRADPPNRTDRAVEFRTTFALDRLMPSDWGVEVPVTLDVERTTRTPTFLDGSDLRADRLVDLRDTESRRTRVGASFRRRTPAANPWLGFFADGLGASFAYTRSSGSTVTTEFESDGLDVGLTWLREPDSRSIPMVPDFAEGFVRAVLPGFLEDHVVDARLRLTPERVSMGSSYARQDDEIFRFDRIVTSTEDSLVTPAMVPREALSTFGDLRLRPFPALTADFGASTERDLLPSERQVTDQGVRGLIRDARTRPLGVDLGWETTRVLRTRIGFAPEVVSWLGTGFDWNAAYRSDRNANFFRRRSSGPDTTLALVRDARGQRDWGVSLTLRPDRLTDALGVGTSRVGDGDGTGTLAGALARAVRPVTWRYREGVAARFTRDAIDPGAGLQLGFTGKDAYRVIQADTAATWTDRSEWSVGSGLDLPAGASVQIVYATLDATTLDVRSDRQVRQRTWPDVQVRLPSLAFPAVPALRSLTLSSGVQRVVRESETGGLATRSSLDEDTRVPVDVTLRWAGTLVTGYQGSIRTGRGIDPTGDTERDEVSHRISVRSRWEPSGAFSGQLDRPVVLAVLAGYVSERRCRITRAGGDCVAFLDQIRRTLSVSLDTGFGDFGVGFQLSFDDRQSFVGQRTGSTQVQFGVFGQLDFSAGALPLG